MMDGLFAANFDEVPESLNSKRNDVGAEVILLVDDANERPAHALVNDGVGDWPVDRNGL